MSASGPKPPSDDPAPGSRPGAREPVRAGLDVESQRAERLNTKAAGIIGLAVMCSRLLGLAREAICAALFGGGGAMDGLPAAVPLPPPLRRRVSAAGRS